MAQTTLYAAVHRLAQETHAFDDADLEQPWLWRAHDEGVRFALLGTYHELCDLAVHLQEERAAGGPALTRAQRALAPYHAAYRDLQALLVGLDEALIEQRPAPGEWPLRTVLGHIVAAERTFFTLVHYGLRRQRSETSLPSGLPDGEVSRVFDANDAFETLAYEGDVADLLAYYDRLHRRALQEFALIDDEELQGPSLWWEGEELSLQYRLHRFDAHLRQHTVQAQKTLEALGQTAGEAKRLLRLVYKALARCEATLIGAPHIGEAPRREMVQTLVDRAGRVTDAVEQARAITQAAQSGLSQEVQRLLETNPRLAGVVNDELLPLALDALYRGHHEIAATLADVADEMDIFTAAALGRLEQVQARVNEWPGYANLVAHDGFRPLQLACYFGREDVALWLMEHDADVDAVAQNEQMIRPIHAAAAKGNLAVVEALLERGAEVNARQQKGFTPLHTAAANGDVALAKLLLAHGADAQAQDDQGRTPRMLAREKGHHEVAALLQAQETT